MRMFTDEQLNEAWAEGAEAYQEALCEGASKAEAIREEVTN